VLRASDQPYKRKSSLDRQFVAALGPEASKYMFDQAVLKSEHETKKYNKNTRLYVAYTTEEDATVASQHFRLYNLI
jgi:hypothetical protein